jgi:uncharacterized protein (TIGR02996 family)
MDFRLWLESQNEDAFLRGYFASGMNPENLLVWADWLEERGDERANILRHLADPSRLYPPGNLEDAMGWEEKPLLWDYYGPSANKPEYIEVAEDKVEALDDESDFPENRDIFRMMLNTKEWFHKKPNTDWRKIPIDSVPLHVLRPTFVRYMWLNF